jgi:hypothetical protein
VVNLPRRACGWSYHRFICSPLIEMRCNFFSFFFKLTIIRKESMGVVVLYTLGVVLL